MSHPAPTDADRIAAEGVTIPTTDGPKRLVYGMRALRAMETKYGSVVALQEAMEALLERFTSGDGKAAAFGPLVDIMAPGLLHLGISEDQAVDLLMPRHVKVYAEAMAAAMREAFPEDEAPAGQGNDAAQVPAQQLAVGSPGQSGTTSQPATDTPPDSGA